MLSFLGKKRGYVCWEKGQATQAEHKEITSIFRQKIRNAKAHREFNLATIVKDNKNVFTNIFTVRERAMRISILYRMQGGT